jgi:DNA-3-methyladenine glycosylase
LGTERRGDPAGWHGRVSRRFFSRPAPVLARALLGRVLVRSSRSGIVAGRIVEVEAYRGADDPASHAFRGRTRRNQTMFGVPGRAYVYFIYGMHHCVNVVAERDGVPGAVLIRALEPCVGEPLMRRRRGTVPWHRLASGPGCVARALGLTLADDGIDLAEGSMWIADRRPWRGGHATACGPRIGIRQGVDRAWRFHLLGHPCVSGGSRAGGLPARVDRFGTCS